MRSELVWVVGTAMAVVSLLLQACRGSEKSDGAVVGSASEVPVSSDGVGEAGEDVIALLDGLRVGDWVAGYEVRWMGAVREDGGIALRLEGGARRMRLVVALDADRPIPPVRTEKYALYYEDTNRRDAASEEDCTRVLEAIAERIRKAEQRVPTPKGMRALPLPAATM